MALVLPSAAAASRSGIRRFQEPQRSAERVLVMDSDPSDWDPLPELGAAQHPGEAAFLGPRVGTGPQGAAGAAAATGQAADPAAPPGTEGPGDPRADRLLRNLQSGSQQFAANRPPTPSLAQVMHTDDARRPGAVQPRPARPQATVSSPRTAGPRGSTSPKARSVSHPDPAAVPRTTVSAGAAPTVVALPAPVGDPRTEQPWFRALPAAEQELLLRAWASESLEVAAAPARRRQEFLEWFWVAYVVFFVAALPLMLIEGLAGFVRMAMAGCVTGIVWQLVPRTRPWCVGSAVVVYAAIAIVPRLDEMALFDGLVSIGGGCIVGYLASLAMHEELHRRAAAP